MDCFDADVLIYAAIDEHELGRRVAPLLGRDNAGGGSVLLIPEVLTKPIRDGKDEARRRLGEWLSRLDLRPVDRLLAQHATALGAKYGLRAADAIHLATAVSLGAERFITNNQRDFRRDIAEVDVVYPADLPEASGDEDTSGT